MSSEARARTRPPCRRPGPWLQSALCAALVLVPTAPSEAASASTSAPVAPRLGPAQVDDAFGRLPLRFEANVGQTDPAVRFVARGAAATTFLTPDEVVLALPVPSPSIDEAPGEGGAADPEIRGRRPSRAAERPGRASSEGEGPAATQDVVRMGLAGANRGGDVQGIDPLPGVTNYLIGRDQRRWRTGVTSYAGVRYRDVYPGIDLRFHGRQEGAMEYDFVVAPGADPKVIDLAFTGAGAPTVDAGGDLLLHSGSGVLRQTKPVVFQEVQGARRQVSGAFSVRPDGHVGFEVGRHDPALPLVIDPVLDYSTYLPGEGYGVAVDRAGSAYVTGSTRSVGFPVKGAAQDTLRGTTDAFVSKLTPDGSALVYSTFFGGTGAEEGNGIAVDGNGGAAVTGSTTSEDLPLTPGALKTTCGSGTRCNGDQTFPDAATTAGSTTLTSETAKFSFNQDRGKPITGPNIAAGTVVTNVVDARTITLSQAATATGTAAFTILGRRPITDAFVVKLAPSGASLAYSSYLGGDRDDAGTGIAMDAAGRPVISGTTLSADLQTTPGAFRRTCGGDARCDIDQTFADGATTAGSTTFTSTEAGFRPVSCCSDSDVGRTITGTNIPAGTTIAAVDTSSFPFTTVTLSQPATASGTGLTFTIHGRPPTSDAFLARIDPGISGLGSLTYSTYLGGSRLDEGTGAAVDAAGNAYLTGYTESSDFPTKNALEATPGEYTDAFVAKFDTGASGPASLLYATYLRGSDGADEATAIALDAAGRAHVIGYTDSTDFPTRNAFQTTDGYAFVSVIVPDGSSIAYSTRLGGTSVEEGKGIAVDAAGATYVTGYTGSDDFPTKGSFQGSGGIFVAKLDTRASGPDSLVYATLYGGSRFDYAGGIAVDSAGNALVTGFTESVDVPTRNALFPTCSPPGVRCRSGYLAKIGPGDPPPQVTGVTPQTGLLSGGTTVVITGVDFTGATQVTFGGVPAASFTVDSPTQITAVTPAHADGLVDVVVTGANGNPSNPSPTGTFTYGYGVWRPTGDMVNARAFHAATLLTGPGCGPSCGKVLVTGGHAPRPSGSSPFGTTTSELYDPATGTWTPTGALNYRRAEHTATLMANGKVLVAGGTRSATTPPEVYDPVTGTWSPTPSMTVGNQRERATATLLSGPSCGSNCGKVLVAGGRSPYLDSAQLYDPATNTWSATGNIPYPVANHVAALLSGPNCGANCGKVLITSGEAPAAGALGVPNTARTALYDPVAGTWRETTPLNAIRVFATATLLSGPTCEGPSPAAWCGKVMVAGGSNNNSLTSIELFDAVAETWTVVATMRFSRYFHTATSLPSGKVLLAGGLSIEQTAGLKTSELFDPATNTTSLAGLLNTPRGRHTATLLGDGRVLAAGGSRPDPFQSGGVSLRSAELYTPGPEVGMVSPGVGPLAGGTPVTITGTGFGGTTSVTFGGVPAASFTVVSPTQVTAVAPAGGIGGTVPLVVMTPNGGSTGGTFTYLGPPGPITDLAAAAVSGTEVRLTFSAPGSNGTDPPPVTRYVVKQSTSPITDDASFNAARSLCGGVCTFNPASVGSRITLTVTGLTRDTTYYYAVRPQTAAGLTGPRSNTASVRTFLEGYWLVASDGGVFAYGTAGFHGSTGGTALNRPVVGIAPTPSGLGYWFVASDGGVFAFGDAGFHGSTGGTALNRPVVGMAPTPSGLGYWLVASDGGVFAFGDAGFFGSTGGTPLNRPIVGMTATPSGRGYWLVASDGGIFAFGDAGFFGSTGGTQLNRPIVAMAASRSGRGYWLVASDGGIFAFGDATFRGSMGGTPLNSPIVGMSLTPSGRGNWLVGADGGIFSLGDAGFLGSTGGLPLFRPIVGMATRPG